MRFIPDSGQKFLYGYRKASISVDASTWPNGVVVPAALTSLSQQIQWVSFPRLFVHIAERTAPPSGYGFSLAETWAFLRYFSAISRTREFCLAQRWVDLDFHQKTILSDDWGMGLASMIATEVFQPVMIAHTSEWLRKVSVAEAKRRPRRRGPAKSPDFVAEDRQGRYHLVEAKGTQGSARKLVAAMRAGVDQKENIEFHHTPSEGSRLVIGTRVPREGGGRVEVIVRDPPLFDITPKDVRAGRVWLRRIGLAGACRAAGLPSFASALVDVEGFRGARGLDAGFELDIRRRTVDREQALAGRQTEIILPSELEGARAWRVTLGMQVNLLESMLFARNLDEFILDYTDIGNDPPEDASPANDRREVRGLADERPNSDQLEFPPVYPQRVVVETPNRLYLTMQPL